MATQEYYIRNEAETEARGPFNIEQLVSLAAAGQVTLETLCYDAVTEAWTPLSTNAELKAAVFPERTKLAMKKNVQVVTLNRPNENAAPITVDDMLAAAEGRTSDTKDKSDPLIAMARAAKIGMWSCVVALLVAAAGEILPATVGTEKFEPGMVLNHPFMILGGIDLLLAVFLAMGVVSTYPFVRFRALLGLGFLGFIFYTQGNETPLFAAAVGSIGLYACTILTNLMLVALAAASAICGMAGLTYYLLSV